MGCPFCVRGDGGLERESTSCGDGGLGRRPPLTRPVTCSHDRGLQRNDEAKNWCVWWCSLRAEPRVLLLGGPLIVWCSELWQSYAERCRACCCGNTGKPTTTPSIPSKFETVFNPDAENAPDGFGRRGYRFKSSGSEVPGPGQYGRPQGIESSAKRPSLSKKGYGAGFASQAERFGGSVLQQVAVQPGPGAYGQDRGVPSDRYTTADTPAASSSFKRAENRSVARRSDPTPGPGAYTPQERNTPLAFNSTLKSAEFRSTTKRFGDARATRGGTAPGPGYYEHATGLGDKTDMLAASLPTAAFRSKTLRGGSRASGAEQFPMDPVFGYNGSDMREGREKVQSVGKTAEKPGPGAYNPKLDMQFSMEAARKSSFFSNDRLDRFGRSVVGELRAQAHDPSPGPGHYELVKGDGPATAAASPRKGKHSAAAQQKPSNIFASTSPRFKGGNDSRRAPGPAYYNPTKPALNRRSYHLNLAQRWV